MLGRLNKMDVGTMPMKKRKMSSWAFRMPLDQVVFEK